MTVGILSPLSSTNAAVGFGPLSTAYTPRHYSSVREWCRKFKEGRTDVHYEGGHGRKSVATVGLVQRVDKVVRGKRSFTISELSDFQKLQGLLCTQL